MVTAARQANKPVVVIVHGGWHPPVNYAPIADPLRKAGYTVLIPALPTAGADDSVYGKTAADDVRRIHEDLLPCLDAGQEAVIIGHSYGGIPTTECTVGQSIQERAARGLKGGIRGVIYMCAYAPSNKGETLIGYDPLTDFFDINEELGICTVNPLSMFRFYHPDVNTEQQPGERERLYAGLVPHSVPSFMTGIAVGAKEIPVSKTYVICTLDEAILPTAQRKMAEGCGGKIVELAAGHSPWLVEHGRKCIIEEIGAIFATANGTK